MLAKMSTLDVRSHEAVQRFETDDAIGFIAVHSTRLGPAFGGTRLWHYDDEAQALRDVLRLSEGMTYKNAVAELQVGGGKSVIWPKRRDFDRTRLFTAFGEAVEALGGTYIAAEDVGTCVADMMLARTATNHVAGLPPRAGIAGGDPSPMTALGVFLAAEVALRHRSGRGIEGSTIAVQGLGSVGRSLCGLFNDAGAHLIVADTVADRVASVVDSFGARAVHPQAILEVEADLVSPCALGAVLNERSIDRLRTTIVVGAANNQLELPARDDRHLAERGILYVPDYVANAGGIVNVLGEFRGHSTVAVEEAVRNIGPRIEALLEQAARDRVTPLAVAQDWTANALASPAVQ